MVDVKQVADAADMIVNGYAFTRCTEGFRVLNLNHAGQKKNERRKIRSLFLPGTGDLSFTGFIFIWQNILQGITFQRWSNPDSEEYSYRDYFSVME